MKKTMIALLMLAGMAQLHAQISDCPMCPSPQSRTFRNFNAAYVNHRHIVTLDKGNKMIVELYDLSDYDQLNDIGGLLSAFKRDITPLKDSLTTSPSVYVRIDYAINTEQDFKKIRIKKYEPDGDMYVKHNDDISRLKVEQDTVRILIERMISGKTKKGTTYKSYRPVQLTFLLNNYTDIDKLIEDQREVQGFIDTMSEAAGKNERHKWFYQTTILFHPSVSGRELYWGNSRFQIYKDVAGDETLPFKAFSAPKRLAFMADIGAGLVAGQLAPMAEAGFEYRLLGTGGRDYLTMARITVSPYFFFRQTGEGLKMQDNWFVNAELGTLSRWDKGSFWQKTTVGVGYLVSPNGDYLKGTTMKAFLNFSIGSSQFFVSPEVIFTNDFKRLFPGVTFKGFFNRD